MVGHSTEGSFRRDKLLSSTKNDQNLKLSKLIGSELRREGICIACLENCRQGAEAIMVIQTAEGFLSQSGHRYDFHKVAQSK